MSYKIGDTVISKQGMGYIDAIDTSTDQSHVVYDESQRWECNEVLLPADDDVLLAIQKIKQRHKDKIKELNEAQLRYYRENIL